MSESFHRLPDKSFKYPATVMTFRPLSAHSFGALSLMSASLQSALLYLSSSFVLTAENGVPAINY